MITGCVYGRGGSFVLPSLKVATSFDDALERIPNVIAGRQMGLLISRDWSLGHIRDSAGIVLRGMLARDAFAHRQKELKSSGLRVLFTY